MSEVESGKTARSVKVALNCGLKTRHDSSGDGAVDAEWMGRHGERQNQPANHEVDCSNRPAVTEIAVSALVVDKVIMYVEAEGPCRVSNIPLRIARKVRDSRMPRANHVVQ